MSKRYQAAIITATYNGLLVPNAPTIGTATAGAGSASVTFTAPSNVGGGAITSYTAISSPGGITGTAASSPVTVSGLTNGTAYTFTVVATNAYGSGPTSAASNSVTPSLNYIEDVFSTWLYTGTGATQTITNGIDLAGKGGLVWSKRRSTAESHVLLDTARNNGSSALYSDATSGQQTAGNFIQSFNSNGYSIGSNSLFNASGSTNVSWTFRKQPKFFDVVTYTGNGGTLSVSHALASKPGCIIIKKTSGTGDWLVCTRKSDGNIYAMYLNTTAGQFYDGTEGSLWTSSAVSINWINSNVAGGFNDSGATYVMYVLAHNAGGFGLTGTDNVISCGSFTTDGSGNATVSLGYEPQWLLLKRSSSTSNWAMQDTMRGWTASTATGDQTLYADLANAEASQTSDYWSPTSTGFTTTGAMGAGTYIYIAIRRGPMAVPTTGTSVFAPVAYTGTGATNIKTNPNFPPDLVFGHQRNAGGEDFPWFSRLTGTYALASNNTAVESDYSTFGVYNMNNVGYTLGTNTILNGSGSTYVNFVAQRAPGFFDEVCYTGNDVASRTISHNLGVPPELVITKMRSGAYSAGFRNWFATAYNLPKIGGTIYQTGVLNATDAFDSRSITGAPTATTFTSSGDASWDNIGPEPYVAYLFASAPGVSKVGSYTGTAATLQINCGFTTGARFVLIKRTDSTGAWYVWDSARGIVAGDDPYLLLNSTAAEVTNTDYVDTYSAGFEISSTAPAAINASGGTFIFLAIA